MSLRRRIASIVIALPFAIPGQAAAFGEDVCLAENGELVDCQPLPPECLPAGTASRECLTAFLSQANAIHSAARRARSTIHADVTHLLAQRVGFSADDAYWIAAYDQATDLVSFEPWDLAGDPVGGGALRTADLSGVNRSEFGVGGVLFHFVVPRNGGKAEPVPGIDGLHPDVEDADTEGTLAHVRAWAAAGSGAAVPLCTAGLTSPSAAGDFATGASCFTRPGGGAAPIRGGLTAVGPVAVPIRAETGLQVVQTGGKDAGPLVLSDAFDAAVGGGPARAAAARLGIYLHALADRISHHVCEDRAVLAGPTGVERAFEADLSNDDCAQTLHGLRHGWETGVDFATLAERDRTTEAALRAVFDELVHFATLRGVLPAGLDAAAVRASLLPRVLEILGAQIGRARVTSLAALACAEGLSPFPGTVACSSSAAPNAPPAGAPGGLDDAASDGAEGCATGPSAAGRDGALLLAVVGVLVSLRRRAARAAGARPPPVR